MPCSWIKLPGGGMAIVKHGAPRYPRCTFCPRRVAEMGAFHDGSLIEKATLLCDFVVGRTLGGDPITCDEKICAKCARRVGDKDFCPKHEIRRP